MELKNFFVFPERELQNKQMFLIKGKGAKDMFWIILTVNFMKR